MPDGLVGLDHDVAQFKLDRVKMSLDGRKVVGRQLSKKTIAKGFLLKLSHSSTHIRARARAVSQPHAPE
jgi:hypothetical protein